MVVVVVIVRLVDMHQTSDWLSVLSFIGMHKMTPPIKDLLPRLTPILKNRHEKVQENCIDLVGRIADRYVCGDGLIYFNL